jgi:hypothetical protein
MSFPLTPATPATVGLNAPAIDRLIEQVSRHVAEGANNRVPDPWHSERMDLISNAMHTAID